LPSRLWLPDAEGTNTALVGHGHGRAEEGVLTAAADLAGVVEGRRCLGLVGGELVGLGPAVFECLRRLRGTGTGSGDHGGTVGSVLVGSVGSGRCGVKAPLGLKDLVNLLGLGKLEVARLLRDDSALVLRRQFGDKLGLEPAGLLGVQVTDFLRDIQERHNDLVVALFSTLLSGTSSATDLNGELLAGSVTDKLAGLLLNVLGGTGGLVHCPALFWALTVTDLLQRLIALSHCFIQRLLLEGDLTGLLKVLFTHLLLGSNELRNIGVMALFHILVCALKNGILLKRRDRLVLFNAAVSRVGICLAAGKVNSAIDSSLLLASLSAEAVAEAVAVSMVVAVVVDAVGRRQGGARG
jgi:hypothetical protein